MRDGRRDDETICGVVWEIVDLSGSDGDRPSQWQFFNGHVAEMAPEIFRLDVDASPLKEQRDFPKGDRADGELVSDKCPFNQGLAPAAQTFGPFTEP